MVALAMIMSDELGDSTTQGGLPHEDHPIQAFFLDRAHEALRISIQIGDRGGRRMTAVRASAIRRRNCAVYFMSRSTYQMALADEKAAELVSQAACDLHHPALVGLRCDASDVNDAFDQLDHEST